MIKRSLQQVLEMVGGHPSSTFNGAIQIEGVSTDSRKIQPGQLYIPLIGDKFDGHAFSSDVANLGAVALLWQRDRGEAPNHLPAIIVEDTLLALQKLASAYRQQVNPKVIGITGSNGKTSTKDMVAAIAATTFRVHKTSGNFNNHIGLPLTILAMDESCQVLILEMGMSGFGEIEQLSLIAKPDAAIITIIGESHMLQLGSRKGIAQAKLEITVGLQPNAPLVIPGNEELLQEVMEEKQLVGKYRLITFGEEQSNDIYLTSLMVQPEYTSFTTNKSDLVFSVPMAGEHNAMNAMAAFAIGEWLQVTPEQVKFGLKQMVPTGMRMEMTKTAHGLSIINDAYNASPTSMRAAIAYFAQLKGYRRKFIVLGDMLELGPDAEIFHRAIGKLLHPGVADAVFTYGEQALWIADEAKANFADKQVEHFIDHESIAAQLSQHANEKDIILIKASRGMKMEQIIAHLNK